MNNSIYPENLNRPLDQFVEPEELKRHPVYLITDLFGLHLTDNVKHCNGTVIAKISPANLNIKEIVLNIPVWEPERWDRLKSELPAWLFEYVENELK
jgi:hypothetical protein